MAATATPEAGKSVLDLLNGKASENIKKLAIDAVRKNIGGAWSALKSDAGLDSALRSAINDKSLRGDALAIVSLAARSDHGDATKHGVLAPDRLVAVQHRREDDHR